MSKTPVKLNTLSLNSEEFSPVNLQTSSLCSQNNLSGPQSFISNFVVDFYNNIQLWNDQHLKGATYIKDIAVQKSDNLNGYTSDLEEQVNKLYETVEKLRKSKDALQLLLNQVEAFSNLQKNSNALFISLNMQQILNLVTDIYEAYDKEFETKVFILENIAHMKTKNDVMFLAAAWTYQTHISHTIRLKLETLLLETGHRTAT